MAIVLEPVEREVAMKRIRLVASPIVDRSFVGKEGRLVGRGPCPAPKGWKWARIEGIEHPILVKPEMYQPL